MKFITIFSISTMAIFAAGCSGANVVAEQVDGDDVSTEEAMKASVKAGTFKLYNEPRHTPNVGCDLYTQLELKANHYSTATLEEHVGGLCEIAAVPNSRTYRLRLDGTNCGSRIYKGSITRTGNKYAITITDNRSRLCEDPIPANVVVEETRNGVTSKKYSYDGAPLSTSAVWPSDATKLVAQSGGGFFRPGPQGSECSPSQSKYTLDVANKKVVWEVCDVNDGSKPYKKKAGTTVLSSSKLATLEKAARSVEVTDDTVCGADKPFMTITVSSASQGTVKYTDSFYSCQGEGPYVDNISTVFTALRDVTGN